jgi:Skp family chaperone for outer membrane proteins
MTRIIIAAAVAAAFATPSLAQNAKVQEAATALVEIQKDQGKLKTYCEMQDLYNKSAEASEKKDEKLADNLGKQADDKAKALGDSFQKVMALEEDINPDSTEGKAFFDALEGLEKSCQPS